ncbi:MAG: hypothetical protein LQ342_005779 [Letrouitia transgressa]|nr:MAG: hypothetical protein LQ342_005779 [Letrouitia transgressa]
MDIQADYSCYITLNNKTDVDFELIDTLVVSGEWPDSQPPNTIDANSSVSITLKDKFGATGSQGSVAYSLKFKKYPDTKITFKLEFYDPYGPWYDNFLGGSTNHPDLISVNVHPYSKAGHPFNAEADIFALKVLSSGEGEKAVAEIDKAAKAQLAAARAQSHGLRDTTALAKRPFQANFSIGFKPEGFIPINKDPVHENIAIAAFIKADQLPQGTTYNNLNPKQWEYFRGLLWNDDPSCLLFDDKVDNNRDFGAGLEWYDAFKAGPANCMTRRSHFGDLQCLHGMATKNGEAPEDTKRYILTWLEVMYKLACGNQGTAVQDKLKTVLPAQFNGSTNPTSDATLKQLLLATTPNYRFSNLQRRALGVCLHIIQDSYAIGHTQRCLLNPGDQANRDENGYIQFKPGTYGRWGSVISFHCYSGQDDDRHSHYDSLEGVAPVPKQLSTFDKILGARDAIDKSAGLINFFTAQTKWEDGVKQFLEQDVFALAPNAKPANSDVDGNVGPCITAGGARAMSDTRYQDLEYAAGLQRKLASLEGGNSGGLDIEAVPSSPLWARHSNGKRSLKRLALLVLLGVFALVVAIVSSAVMSRLVAKVLF